MHQGDANGYFRVVLVCTAACTASTLHVCITLGPHQLSRNAAGKQKSEKVVDQLTY